MAVKFWGTRGTRMVTGDALGRYGRKTICTEVRCGDRIVIFDAGSGLVPFGADLLARDTQSFDLFLTHAHYDHVEGIPFFQPFYDKRFSVRLWSGRLKGIDTARDIVDGLMKEPYFPIRQEKFQARIRYRDIADEQVIDLGDGITVKTMRLHHPGGATGYRIEFDGATFGFITDTTHAPGQRDRVLVDFLQDIDAFAYDCSYLDAEFPQFASYGHSTWQEALRLKDASGAGAVYGLHHMPFRGDEALDTIAARILSQDAGCHIATDGMEVLIGD